MSSRSTTPKQTTAAPAAPSAETPDQTPQTGGAGPEASAPSAPPNTPEPTPPAGQPEQTPAPAAPLAPPSTPVPATPVPAPQPAAAPLAPPATPSTASAAPLVAPVADVPADADAFLGYVDDSGEPLDPDDLFDLGGVGTIVVAKCRINALIRRGNSRTKLMSLAFPQGMEVNRGAALDVIARARAVAAEG
ncbi:hypothetical protein ACQSSU_20720 [Micromonospora echinospora]